MATLAFLGATGTVTWVVLTHGHIDHTGYLPRLINDGFRAPISSTAAATADLVKILLPDSGHLQEEEAAYHNRRGTSKHTPALPLYTAEQGLAAGERVKGVAYQMADVMKQMGSLMGDRVIPR